MVHWFQSLLTDYGYWFIFVGLFLNNIGIPIPGDTILLASGFFCEKRHLLLWITLVCGTLGCFMGANCGYWIGLRFGYPLLFKIRWLKLMPQKIERVENFFKKYGAKAVFFARFVALLHPVTGLLAGVGKTPLRPFLFYNLVGSAAYVCLYVFMGYFFGGRWGQVKIWMGDAALYILLMVSILIAAFVGLLLWRFMWSFYKASFKKS
jgi:membrane protein DedA with SNARE-associated domain